jgi:hypothetical protein
MGITPVAGNGVVDFPRPSWCYLGNEQVINQHLQGLPVAKGANPTYNSTSNGRAAYIFVGVRDRSRLMAHANYQNIINR